MFVQPVVEGNLENHTLFGEGGVGQQNIIGVQGDMRGSEILFIQGLGNEHLLLQGAPPQCFVPAWGCFVPDASNSKYAGKSVSCHTGRATGQV